MHPRSRLVILSTAMALCVGLFGVRAALAADDGAPVNSPSALQAQQHELETQLTAIQAQLHQALLAQYHAAQVANPAPVTAMQFYIPHLKQAPVIDGVIDEKEWAGAIAVPISGDGTLIARPNSVFYLGWDGDYLYVAQRYPLLPNEKPVRVNREPGPEHVSLADTRVELFIDRKAPGSVPSGCRYQFMGNASGNQWEREEQYEIGQNRLGWGGAWQYKQRVTPDGQYWEAEMAIPRATLFQNDPLHDGEVCWLGLATDPMYNFPRSGCYGWTIPATLKDDTPEIRLAHPERCLNGKRVAFDLGIHNTTAAPFNAVVTARLMKAGAKADEPPVYEYKAPAPLALAPGERSDLHVDAALDTVEDHTPYTLSIMVLQGDKSVYSWSTSVRFADPGNNIGLDYTPELTPWHAWADYAPLSNVVKIGADVFDLPNNEVVKKVRYRIVSSGKSNIIASGECGAFHQALAEEQVSLPRNLAPGQYECTVTLLDATGTGVGSREITFERKSVKQLRWLDNHLGENDRVLKPFTPLSVKDEVIYGYQKAITLAGSGLPAAITAHGIRLLASPIYLRGQWHNEPFSIEGVKKTPQHGALSSTQVNYSARALGGPLALKTEYHLEYDGTAKITLRLSPAEKGGRAALDNLQLVIPFTQDGATYMMVDGLNSEMANRAGRIPGAGSTGTVWTSRDVPAQQMTVGSFVPIVHVGNRCSGLTWFADSDQGWWPSDKKPAIEMVRTVDGRIDLIFNLASEPVEFSEEHVITFGLCTVPTRPSSEYKSPACVPGLGFEQETGKWDPAASKTRVYARQYPDSMKKWNEVNGLVTKFGDYLMPYTEQSPADYFAEDWQYMRTEWADNPFCQSVNDYRLFQTARWIKEGKLDGYYLDNIRPRLNRNTYVGTAYLLPDGRVQPGYDLWAMRDYVKRLRTVFQKNRPLSMICMRHIDCQFAPVLSFSDDALGGEIAAPSGGGPDWMDLHARDSLDVQCNQYLWGYHLDTHLRVDDHSFLDDLGQPDAAAAAKAQRTITASLLTHGLEQFGPMTSHFQLLKKLTGGLEFIPAYAADGRFKISDGDPDLDVAVYANQSALLVIVANYAHTRKNASVWIDFPKLLAVPGLAERRINVDFEDWNKPGPNGADDDPAHAQFSLLGSARAQQNTLYMANTLTLPVEARDYRAFLILNAPVAGAAEF